MSVEYETSFAHIRLSILISVCVRPSVPFPNLANIQNVQNDSKLFSMNQPWLKCLDRNSFDLLNKEGRGTRGMMLQVSYLLKVCLKIPL